MQHNRECEYRSKSEDLCPCHVYNMKEGVRGPCRPQVENSPSGQGSCPVQWPSQRLWLSLPCGSRGCSVLQTSAQTGLAPLCAERAHDTGTQLKTGHTGGVWCKRTNSLNWNFSFIISLIDKQPPEISWNIACDFSNSTLYDVYLQTNNCFQPQNKICWFFQLR